MKTLIALIAVLGSVSSASAYSVLDPNMPETTAGRTYASEKKSDICPMRAGGTLSTEMEIHPGNAKISTTPIRNSNAKIVQ